MLWSHDLVAEFGAPPTLVRPAVKAGYGTSPTAYKHLVIVTVGGEGQSVMAFRQDGRLVLARLSPDGLTELAAADVLDTTAWTAPTLVGTRLYVRDRAQIMALELGE